MNSFVSHKKQKVLIRCSVLFLFLFLFSVSSFASLNVNIGGSSGGGSESDTLQTVTDRGSTTTNSITTTGRLTVGNTGLGFPQALTVYGGAAGNPIIRLERTGFAYDWALAGGYLSFRNALTGKLAMSLSTGTLGGENLGIINIVGDGASGSTEPRRGNALIRPGRPGVLASDSPGGDLYIEGGRGYGTPTSFIRFTTANPTTSGNNLQPMVNTMELKEGQVGIGTTTPNQKLQVIGNVNVSGTVYYGSLQANSPHAFLADNANEGTRICKQATNGVVLMEKIELVNGKYQVVYYENEDECNKEVLKSSYTYNEFVEENGVIYEAEIEKRTFENVWSKNSREETIKNVKSSLPLYQIGNSYSVNDRFQFEGIAYEVIQEHVAQEDWNPKNTLALYKELILFELDEITEWVQPQGAHDCYPIDALVTFNGQTYKSTHSCNVWSPTVYGWVVQ